MPDQTAIDEIRAEAKRTLKMAENPHNSHVCLMTALGLIAQLAEALS